MSDEGHAAKTGMHKKRRRNGKRNRRSAGTNKSGQKRFAALDLGTNNCRLLVAAPSGKSLRIIDAFSRIVRLGEGLSQSGRLSEAAMERTIDALLVCAEKVKRRNVTHIRCIATQACRGADNGQDFLDQIREKTGLEFEIISAEEEARLATAGCSELIDPMAPAVMIFDIGGGSTELSWLKRDDTGKSVRLSAWTSMPFGVVNLAERWGGADIDSEKYEAIVRDVQKHIADFGDPAGLKKHFENDRAHLLGTSGTVTSIAGVHLELERYRRDRVDGLWLSAQRARQVSEKLRMMSFNERADEPCIGADRADLVVCGCAILEALMREWPVTRIRVADRGLREGILADLSRGANDRPG